MHSASLPFPEDEAVVVDGGYGVLGIHLEHGESQNKCQISLLFLNNKFTHPANSAKLLCLTFTSRLGFTGKPGVAGKCFFVVVIFSAVQYVALCS